MFLTAVHCPRHLVGRLTCLLKDEIGKLRLEQCHIKQPCSSLSSSDFSFVGAPIDPSRQPPVRIEVNSHQPSTIINAGPLIFSWNSLVLQQWLESPSIVIRSPFNHQDDIFDGMSIRIAPGEGSSRLNTQIVLWALLDLLGKVLGSSSGRNLGLIVPVFDVMLYGKGVGTIQTLQSKQSVVASNVSQLTLAPSNDRSSMRISRYFIDIEYYSRDMGWLPILGMFSNIFKQLLQYFPSEPLSNHYSIGSEVRFIDLPSQSQMRLILTDLGPNDHPHTFEQTANALRYSFIDLIRQDRWVACSVKVSYDDLEFLTIEWAPPSASNTQNAANLTAAPVEIQ